MSEEEKEEVSESQKLSNRDKKELQNGLCVNCALVSILFMVFTIIVMVL
jgi:hypothetical protein